jgi:hypothetical protein
MNIENHLFPDVCLHEILSCFDVEEHSLGSLPKRFRYTLYEIIQSLVGRAGKFFHIGDLNEYQSAISA